MKIEDIEVGIVNSFSCKEIKGNMALIKELERNYGEPSDLLDESRPFVCIGHQGELSQWAEITTEDRQERLLIKPEWRTWQDGDARHKPTVRWKREIQYLHGAVFEGPDDVWAKLATDHNSAGNYKIVTEEGLKAIRQQLTPQIKDPLFSWEPTASQD